MKIMVVDDEPSMRLFVKAVMEEAGFECRCAESGASALACLESERPDAMVLDVMMPRMDGYEVCRRIREIDPDMPILFLSAKGDIVDKRTGFSNGGDDYLVKPFDEEELLMRIEALLRRARRSSASASPPQRFAAGDFSFDTVRHQVILRGRPVSFTPKEHQLLLSLASHEGAVMSKEELIENVWGSEYLGDAISVAAYVRKIREKIEDDPADPRYLRTVWGVGYVFDSSGR